MTRIDSADQAFSWWIRLRDKGCKRCFSSGSVNDKGLPNSHDNSHYFGRSHEVTRFDPENCDELCRGCHSYFEERNKKAYTDFKLKQLGQEKFDALVLRGNATLKQLGMRKDRKLQALAWKKQLYDDYGIRS